jgi:hypothetical protein
MTPEEAEFAAATAPEVEFDVEANFAKVLRWIHISDGRIPLSEATQEEVDRLFQVAVFKFSDW